MLRITLWMTEIVLDQEFSVAHHAFTERGERHRKGSNPKAHQPKGEVRTGR